MRLISTSGIIGLLALCLAPGAQSIEVDVGGYIDTQFNYSVYQNRNGYAGSTPALALAGVKAGDTRTASFRFHEGEVTLGSKVANYRVFVDLALLGPAKQDTFPQTLSTVSTVITVGQAQSQAFIGTSYDNGFDWTLGQFDSRFGFEGNDPTSYRYSDRGILHSAVPISHVGLMVGYAVAQDIRFEALVANSYDQGHLKEGNFDFGAKLRSNMGSWWANIGVLGSTGNHDQVVGLERAFGYFVDADVGFNVAAHEVGLFAYVKRADVEKAKSDFGIGFDVGIDPDVGLGYGLRLEYMKDGTDSLAAATPAALTGVNDDVSWELTVGPQWHFHKNLVAKLDYVYQRTSYDENTVVNFNNQENHQGNLAVVYAF